MLALAGFAAVLGCQERLTEPVDCPTLCPGGDARVIDTFLTALPLGDSSHAPYVGGNAAASLLVSNGLDGRLARAIYRFVQRRDSVEVLDTNRTYLVDSVLIAINLRGRDTLLDGLKLFVYRISPDVGSDITFATLEPQLVEANLIDSVAVPDTLASGIVQLKLHGADVLKTGLRSDSGGTLAIGVALGAPQPTGVRFGSLISATGAGFVSYVTAQNVPDTASGRQQALEQPTAFSAFVTDVTPTPDPDLLTVGDVPSSRTLLRFDLPERLEDSATIVRATLELTPARPVRGIASDPALLVARSVLADLGAKSVVADDRTSPQLVAADTLMPGTTAPVQLDVTNLVRLWQATDVERPEAIFLSLSPEAGSFTVGEFGSTRRPDIGVPRLRITYMLAFPFEKP